MIIDNIKEGEKKYKENGKEYTLPALKVKGLHDFFLEYKAKDKRPKINKIIQELTLKKKLFRNEGFEVEYQDTEFNVLYVRNQKRGRGKKKKKKKEKEAKPEMGAFQKGKAVTSKINREGYHTGNVTISPDGNTMFFTRMLMSLDGKGNTIGESKLYFSEKNGNSWKGAKEVEGVNGEWIVKHPSVGEHFGKEVLYFSSDMAGGEGGFDIYYSRKMTDGTWDLPENLGSQINTEGNELFPFIDNDTMYFSSDMPGGFGGMDRLSDVLCQ